MNMNRIYVCPFFETESNYGMKIICDSATAVCFPGKKEAAMYVKKYCCNNPGWRDCTIAAMYEDHYEQV